MYYHTIDKSEKVKRQNKPYLFFVSITQESHFAWNDQK